MKRIYWTHAENEALRESYNRADKACIPYQRDADMLNERFHGGDEIRTAQSVARNPNSGGRNKPLYGIDRRVEK
jgi:hypothetical protein